MNRCTSSILLLAVLAALPDLAHADAVTEANARASEIASTIKATPIAVRALAITQVSVYDALQSIAGLGQPIVANVEVKSGASADAAVAAATRQCLLALVPDQKDRIEADYQAALSSIADGAAKADGIAAGERAASAVLAARARDGFDAALSYRPRTSPGVWVPTAMPLVPHWGKRTPWLMTTGSQFRPGPPPKLASERWKKDLAEVAALGAKNSTTRTAEQTAIARFWQTTSPTVYWPIARSVATARQAQPVENARLLADAAMAMDDAAIAVFDAKYAYGFWRPVTAVRNGPAGIGDPAWEPLVETPMHPEYPCAHCIISATLGAVLEAAIGTGPSPRLRTTSPTGDGERSWATVDEMVREVSEARICAGVHYRNSTEVGRAMGRKIGELATRRAPQAAR
jgi:hypothetical protein